MSCDDNGMMPGEVLNAILDGGLNPIAAWRRYRGLSQAELARRTGLSQVWLSRIENGDGTGSAATRRKLAEALDAPVWALEVVEGVAMRPEYDALTLHLRRDGRRTITMTFDEVIAVVKKLPDSAYNHDEWWQPAGHSHARAWVNAGYRAVPSRVIEKVTFEKVD